MHALLGALTLLLSVVGGTLVLRCLRRQDQWPNRRELQVTVLAAPTVSLGLGIAGLHHFVGRTCFLGAPPWDYTLGLALPIVMGTVAIGGIAFGVIRQLTMQAVVASRGRPAPPPVQTLVERLAGRLRTAPPRVLLYPSDRPLAITYGMWRPTVLVSPWMLEHLDPQELESVIAHEVAHVARRDYLVVWLATVLRDAFIYLPTSWAAYRQLQHEKELASDDLAVQTTNRRLALASALARVYEQALTGPSLGPAPGLVEPERLIEGRIERLLATPPSPVGRSPSRRVAIGIAVPAVAALLASEAATVAALLTPMGCGPRLLLG